MLIFLFFAFVALPVHIDAATDSSVEFCVWDDTKSNLRDGMHKIDDVTENLKEGFKDKFK